MFPGSEDFSLLRRAAARLTAAAPVCLGPVAGTLIASMPLGLAAQEPLRAESFAFEDVAVVSIDDGRILPDRTVVVRNGEIIEVAGSESTSLPEDAVRIAGEGRYLAPGMADMSGRLPAEDDPMRVVVLDEILFMYLANGVTTVRIMDGAPYQLELRDAIASGSTLGPTLYVGSPAFGESSDPSSVAEAVRSHSAEGYDFLTLEEGLGREAWASLVEAAGEEEISFGGRVPSQVGLELALDAGISTADRLDGYLEATRRDGLPDGASPADRFRATDPLKLERLARRTAQAGVYPIPLQYLSHHVHGWNELLGGRVGPDSVRTLPEFGYVPDSYRDGWVEEARRLWSGAEIAEEAARAYAEWRRELVSALHAAGAPILLGTHSPGLLNVPGFALHRELPLMVNAGLTRAEALRTATLAPADYVQEELGRPGDSGAVAPGQRADLLLLEENPLESFHALWRPAGVMVRGLWLSPEAIDERMGEIAERYREFDVD